MTTKPKRTSGHWCHVAYNVSRAAFLIGVSISAIRQALADGRFVWSDDGLTWTYTARPLRNRCAVCDAPCRRMYCGKRCAMRAYHASVARPLPRCRCGWATDLLPVPADMQPAWGAWVCRYCVDEGLRRAA